MIGQEGYHEGDEEEEEEEVRMKEMLVEVTPPSVCLLRYGLLWAASSQVISMTSPEWNK